MLRNFTDAKCHLGFHMDRTLITELYYLLNDDFQNQIVQLTCVISQLATNCADSAGQSMRECCGETLNLLSLKCQLQLLLSMTYCRPNIYIYLFIYY